MNDDDSLMKDDSGPPLEEVEVPASIWDDEMIDRHSDVDGKPRWRCKYCNEVFSGHNATKVIMHLNKVTKQDIRTCRAKIDADNKKVYAAMLQNIVSKREKIRSKNTAIGNHISSHNSKAAASLQDSRASKKPRTSTALELTQISELTAGTSNNIIVSNDVSQRKVVVPPSLLSTTAKKSMLQTVLYDNPSPEGEMKLTKAIADMIHSLGLPLLIVDDQKFKSVLKLAKAVSSKYVPPSRKCVSEDLLDLNYNEYMKYNNEKLQMDADKYGISLFGDGATIKKVPLLNILASGVHLPACVLSIVDCTKHLQDGGKKDAVYIASHFEEHINWFEEQY
jgi:hypothetical protein